MTFYIFVSLFKFLDDPLISSSLVTIGEVHPKAIGHYLMSVHLAEPVCLPLTHHVSDAGAGQGPAAHHPLCLHGGARLGRELRQGGVQRPAHPPQRLGLGL